MLTSVLCRIRRHRATRSRGQSLVEFALVTPILLLLFAGVGDLGRAFYGYVAIENAAKEGALYGSRYPLCDKYSLLCPDPDNVRWRFQQELGPNVKNGNGSLIAESSVCIDASSGNVRGDLRYCVPGDTYVVSASYAFSPITPILSSIIGGDLTVSTASTAVVVNLAFDPTPGIAPTKLVRATDARNASEVASKCTVPDPSGSAGFYRAPCKDSANNDVQIKFRKDAPITYKVIVRNNGGTNLTGVTITDSLGWPGGCPAKPPTLNVGATPYTCTYTRTAPAPAGGAVSGAYVNLVTADSSETLPASDQVSVIVELPPADLRVLKWVSAYEKGGDGDGVPNFGSDLSITVTKSTQVTPYAWFKVIVQSIGGQPATSVAISDTNAALPYGTATCDPKPTTLAVGEIFRCRYRVDFSTAVGSPFANTVTVSSPDDTVAGNNTATATVTVAACTGTDRTVPNLVGRTETQAVTDWAAAGFTGAMSSYNPATAPVATQNLRAFRCVAPNSTITITKTTTP